MAESLIVNISEGKVEGCFGTNLDGEQYFSFFGIPYAKAPVGELRFKAPQPVEEWDGVRDATKIGDSCAQKDMLNTKAVKGSEHCLHLNVFTRTLPDEGSSLKPVMVWIHGGGFTSGSSDPKFFFGPEYIMTKDVVLVSINYRIGFLGFLTLEDASLDVPGNAGMKDQVLALKWVQRNIKHFGGDPNNVTIFGESAGGASVHYLILSPSAKGLFHKAILQSGVALNPWVASNFNIYDFMNFIGREVKNEEEGLHILKDLRVDELVELQDEYLKTKLPFEVVGPTVEKPNPTAFLTKSPIEIITSGEWNKVPMMMGYTSNEGLLFAFGNDWFKDPQIESEHYIHPDMKLEKGCSTSKLICKKIKDYYSQEKNAYNPYMLHSDYYFVAGIIGSAKLHARTSNHLVYLYRVTLETGLNVMKRLFKVENLPGVSHGDELGYLFKVSVGSEIELGEPEIQGIRRFLELWTNFAAHGNPTPGGTNLNVEWKSVEEEQVNILDIGQVLTMQTNPEMERMNLWKDIYQLSPATAKYL
nr:esterase B1-like isoform X1 [Leptinotarsa decemlineata]